MKRGAGREEGEERLERRWVGWSPGEPEGKEEKRRET
jgi:hypothetical protein